MTRFVESLGFKMPTELEIQKYNHIQNIYRNKFPKELLLEKEDYLTLVSRSNSRYALRDVPEELRDREMYLAAVSNDGDALYAVPEELRDEIRREFGV